MTCQEIYDITMALMDEMLNNGDVDYASTKDYTARTPGILTILQTQVVMYLKGTGANVDSLNPLSSMTDEVDLDQDICTGVLPYGLAARLLGQEDSAMSSYFNQLYANGLADSKDSVDGKYIAEQKVRENVYGLFEAGD
jgi:hypothetical protein